MVDTYKSPPEKTYGPKTTWGPKSISRDLHFAPDFKLPESSYGPPDHYVPDEGNEPEGPYMVLRGQLGPSKDPHGNVIHYALYGALTLFTAFWLEAIQGTFIRKINLGAFFDKVWPILPFRTWVTRAHDFFSGSYVGLSVELPPIPPPPAEVPAPDTTLPVVTEFTMPTSAQSRSVAVNTFIVNDNRGVVGYLITEDPTIPNPEGLWYTAPYTRFVFANYGPNIAYAWVMDSSGNVSLPAIATVDCIPASPPAAIEELPPPPERKDVTVATFVLEPVESSRRRVNVKSFTGDSWLTITGYLITDSTLPPLYYDSRWEATPPTTYTFPADGEQTAYAWVRDGSNSVSPYKAFVVTVNAEGVHTYVQPMMMPHGFENPYPGVATLTPNGALTPHSTGYPASKWYAQNQWIQLNKTWDYGRNIQATITLNEDQAPDTFHMGINSNNATPFFVPCDDGRVVAFNSFTEENLYIGVPELTGDVSVSTTKYPNMGVAPLIDTRGRPANNGFLYFSDGESGAYLGSNDVIYTLTFNTYYLPIYLGTRNYTFKHIMGDINNGYFLRATISGTLPPNFALLDTVSDFTLNRKTISQFTSYFLSQKSAVQSALFNRGRKPLCASNVHDPAYTNITDENKESIGTYIAVTWHAVCTGVIPTGGYGDITIDGVVSLSLLSWGVSHSGSYRHGVIYGNDPNSFPFYFPAAYPPCDTTLGGYSDTVSFGGEFPIETGFAGLDLYVRQVDFYQCGGLNYVFASVTGFDPNDELLDPVTYYTNKATIIQKEEDPTINCTTIMPTVSSYIHQRKAYSHDGSDIHAFDQRTWLCVSHDRGLTWARIPPQAGLTDTDLTSYMSGARSLNGDSLVAMAAKGNLYLISGGAQTITQMDPYGYDASGVKLRVQDRVADIVGTTCASKGQMFFYTNSQAGDFVNPQVRYFISTTNATIETNGPEIESIGSVTCFGPDKNYTMQSYTIEGYGKNIIRVEPPLPNANTIVVVTITSKIENQKRLLLLSDWGATVYDAGWVESNWTGEMMLHSFAGGGFDPAYAGDTSYPYTPPPFVPLQFVNGPDLGEIIGSIEDEYFQIQVMGGRFPYGFEVTAGALPTGMALDAVGYIEGVATIGSYSFTIKVTDNEGSTIEQAFTARVV
jgi:hypothetical protein